MNAHHVACASLFKLPGSRSHIGQNLRDVKNEGRPGDVYENKGSQDNMTEKTRGPYDRNCRISQVFSGFSPEKQETGRILNELGAYWSIAG